MIGSWICLSCSSAFIRCRHVQRCSILEVGYVCNWMEIWDSHSHRNLSEIRLNRKIHGNENRKGKDCVEIKMEILIQEFPR